MSTESSPSRQLHRVLRRAVGVDVQTIGSCGGEVEEIAPAETQEVLPTVYEPATRERALEGNGYQSVERGWELADRTRIEHAPMRRFRLRDVSIRGNTLWLGSRRFLHLSRGSDASPLGRLRVEERPCALAETRFATTYFGHWIWDDLPLWLQVRDDGLRAVRVNNPAYPHAGFYTEAIGSPPEVLAAPTLFRELWLYDGVSQSLRKQALYREVRTRLAAAVGLADRDAADGPGLVMLYRGDSGVARSLVNEAEVAEWVEGQGGRVVDPQNEKAEDVVRAIWNAGTVLGVEGSQWAPAFFAAAPGAAMVLIQPPRRFGMLYKGLNDSFGFSTGMVVGEPAGEGIPFRVPDLNELERVVERTRAQRERAMELQLQRR